MFAESALLPISALQHLLFCERQCALIHVERLWAENRFTVEGRHLHRRAHDGRDEWRGNVRIVRGLWLSSYQLGLVGQADVVEIEVPCETRWTGRGGQYPFSPSRKGGQTPTRVTPVEYKRGRPKKNDSDRVQLCAQALCLEEMLGVPISDGELYYGKRKRRTHVAFDETLRSTTEAAAMRLHQMMDARETPPAVREKKCDTCSLFQLCLPEVTQAARSASRFAGRQFSGVLHDAAPMTDPFELSQSPT
jgi:CRISPR-associated exonuclease Cas4